MKKTIIYATIGLFLIGSATTSCSKYEEGSKLTVLTKKARIVGTWKLTNSTTGTISQNFDANSIVYEIKKTGDYVANYVSGSTSVFAEDGKWEFSKDKKNLLITSTGSTTIDSYEIVELKSKELKLRTKTAGISTTNTYTAQ